VQISGIAKSDSATDIGVLQLTGVISTHQYLELSCQFSEIIQLRNIDLVDFRRAPGLLWHLVCDKGLVLFERQPGIFANFRLYAWNLYQDERTATRRLDREAIQTARKSFFP